LKILLSQSQRAQGKLAEAEETAQAASTRAARSKDLALYTRCLDEVADVLIARENFAAVEEVMAEALRIEWGRSHPDPKLVAQRVYRVGLAQYRSGRLEEAFPTLEQVRELYEKAFGAEGEETGRMLMELGVMYRAQAQHSQAQKHLRSAMHIQERLNGAESQDALAALHQLAGSLEESGDTNEAAAMYERSLNLRELVVGTDQEVIAEEQFRLVEFGEQLGVPPIPFRLRLPQVVQALNGDEGVLIDRVFVEEVPNDAASNFFKIGKDP
jgi:tetratricopeptide (TPR) repeat protein